MCFTALPEEFKKYFAVYDDGHMNCCAGISFCRGRCGRNGCGAIKQFRQPGLQRFGNALDIIQADIMFGAFNRTDIAAVESAEFGEYFL